MNFRYVLVISILILIFQGCQRQMVSTAEESPAEKNTKTLDSKESKPEFIRKELNYKDLPLNQQRALQPASTKEKTDSLSFKTLFESGYQKHNAGDFSGAIADFSKCISLNPGYSDAWNLRGMSKYKSGDKQGACNDWKRAAELGYGESQKMMDTYCK